MTNHLGLISRDNFTPPFSPAPALNRPGNFDAPFDFTDARKHESPIYVGVVDMCTQKKKLARSGHALVSALAVGRFSRRSRRSMRDGEAFDDLLRHTSTKRAYDKKGPVEAKRYSGHRNFKQLERYAV